MLAFDSHMAPFRDEAWAVRESAVLSAIRHVQPGATAMGTAPMQPTDAQVSPAAALPVEPISVPVPADGDSAAMRMAVDDDLVSPHLYSRAVIDQPTLL